MCFDGNKRDRISEIRVAKRNIKIFKLMAKDNTWNCYVTPYRDVRLDRITNHKCTGQLTRFGDFGYYSFSNLREAKLYKQRHYRGRTYKIFTLYIPKGSRYVRGFCSGKRACRSEYLIEKGGKLNVHSKTHPIHYA